MATIIDGKKWAGEIRKEVKVGVDETFAAYALRPKLAVVLVAEREESMRYVRMKIKAAEEVGIKSEVVRMSGESTTKDIVLEVTKLNLDEGVHGILVQLPLPDHVTESDVIGALDPRKDVDGLHPETFGRMAAKNFRSTFNPCTAEGCVELCKREAVDICGKEVVVVGRSPLVGMSASLLFQQANGTVTMAHSKTHDLASVCRRADILIVAVGKTGLVKGEWIKKGATIIDVGISPVDIDGKVKLRGDVDFESVKEVAGRITPVPGGVGPMTVAVLLRNALKALLREIERQEGSSETIRGLQEKHCPF